MDSFNSKNFTDPELKEIYKGMDYISNIAYLNLISLSKSTNKIVLKGLDTKNKEHSFILEMAFIAEQLNDKHIYVTGNPFKILWFNIKNRESRKRINYISKKRADKYSIPYVNEILEFMRPVMEEWLALIDNPNFGMIYDEYYSGKEK